MPRQLNKLSANEVKNAKGSATIRKLADGGGLTLFVRGESKYWWFRYRFAGKEKTLSLGSYPQISLAARQARDEARTLLQQKIDPSAHKRQEFTQRVSDGENTFRSLCEDWYQQKHSVEVTEAHAVRNWRRLEIYTFPLLARRPILQGSTVSKPGGIQSMVHGFGPALVVDEFRDGIQQAVCRARR